MNFRKRHGQAFETMMLVISVIVALAILGVLLNILGGVGGLFNPSNPVDSIKKELVSIGGQYSPGDRIIEVKFTEGQTINARRVTEGNPSVQESDLQFYVHENIQDYIEPIDNGGIKVRKDVDAIVVVCGDSAIPKYVVAVARKAVKDTLGEECRRAGNIP